MISDDIRKLTILLIRDFIKQQKEIRVKIATFMAEDDTLQRKINDEMYKLPMIYGRCIKELVCHHQSDQYNTSDTTTIKVGDVIEFFRYPQYNSITFHPNCGEYFEVPYSEEYFEFFTSEDQCPDGLVSFNGD